VKVYLVWYGYEDVDAVFLKEENAKAFVEEQLKEKKWRHPLNYSICEEEVVDA
jgi:hypothetical protein